MRVRVNNKCNIYQIMKKYFIIIGLVNVIIILISSYYYLNLPKPLILSENDQKKLETTYKKLEQYDIGENGMSYVTKMYDVIILGNKEIKDICNDFRHCIQAVILITALQFFIIGFALIKNFKNKNCVNNET